MEALNQPQEHLQDIILGGIHASAISMQSLSDVMNCVQQLSHIPINMRQQIQQEAVAGIIVLSNILVL